MIRPFTFLCMITCIGSGLYLYSEKHTAEMLDRQIAHVIRAKEAARQRTGLLRADWALLNEPGRLQAMADSYLALKPMAPNQFVQMADLGAHLPGPLAAPAGGAQAGSTDDATTDAADPAASPAVAPPVDAGAELTPKPAPADPGLSDATVVADKPAARNDREKVAHAAAAAHASTKLAAHAATRKTQHSVALATRDGYGHDNPLARSAPLPLATPQPMGARVMSAMARADRLRAAHSTIGGWTGARPAVATAVPRALAPSPYVGSALAGGGSLPPPVPMGAQ